MLNKDIEAYVRANPKKFPGKVGDVLGQGGDGVAFAFGGGGVIKVGHMPHEFYNVFDNIISKVENSDYQALVDVDDHDVLEEDDEGVLYYYVMPKLKKLSPEDRAAIIEMLELKQPKSTRFASLKGISPNVAARIEEFKLSMEELPFEHLDPGPHNVMKTYAGEFKFIDIESFVPGLE